MHQGKPDVDLGLSVNDITTLVQHVPPDMAGATREHDETHRLPESKSTGESPMTVSVGQTFVTKLSMFWGISDIVTICREYTSTRDEKECQQIGIIDDNTVIGPTLDVRSSAAD